MDVDEAKIAQIGGGPWVDKIVDNGSVQYRDGGGGRDPGGLEHDADTDSEGEQFLG